MVEQALGSIVPWQGLATVETGPFYTPIFVCGVTVHYGVCGDTSASMARKL